MSESSATFWLAQIDEMILKSNDLADVTGLLKEALLAMTSSEDIDILLMGADNMLHLVEYLRPWEKGVEEVLIQNSGIIGHVVNSNVPVLISDVTKDEKWSEIYVAGLSDIKSVLAAPIPDSKGAVSGVINLESSKENAFTVDHLESVQILAGQLAIAIDRLNRFERLQRAKMELELLKEIEIGILNANSEQSDFGDEADIYDLMLKSALQVTQAHRGDLAFYDPSTHKLYTVASTGGEDMIEYSQGLEEGIAGLAATDKKIINVRNVKDSKWASIYLEVSDSTRSELVVPILAEDNRLVGVFDLESDMVDAFTQRDEKFVESLANQLLLANKQRANLMILEAVSKISARAIQDSETNNVIDEVLKQAIILFDAALSDIAFYDYKYSAIGGRRAIRKSTPPNKNLIFTEAIDKEHLHIYEDGIMGEVAKTGVHYLSNNTEDDDLYTPDPIQPIVRSELAMPMFDKYKKLVGVINVESPHLHAFTHSDIDLLQNLANQAAAVLVASEQRKIDESSIFFGVFAHNIVHRVGNLIGAVPDQLGVISSLLPEDVETAKRKISGTIEVIEQARSIINSISEASKLSLYASQEEPEIVDVNELLKEISNKYPVIEDDIKVVFDLSDEEPKVFVPYDPLLSALVHIYMNSVQILTDHGDGQITLKSEKAGRIVRIIIFDNGPGVNPAIANSIFEYGVSTKGVSNSGYGLFSARNAIVLSGGDIFLDSGYSEGAKFIISFNELDK